VHGASGASQGMLWRWILVSGSLIAQCSVCSGNTASLITAVFALGT
jgi:hypothetical protein